MPLNSNYIPRVKGLDTESPLDNREPNSLQDCSNVVISRAGVLTSRHGHTVQREYTSSNRFDDISVSTFKDQSRFVSPISVFGGGYNAAVLSPFVPTNNYTNYVLATSPEIPSAFVHNVCPRTRVFFRNDRNYIMTNFGLFYQLANFDSSTQYGGGSNQYARNDLRPVLSSFSTSYSKEIVANQPTSKNWMPVGNAVLIKVVIEEETKIDEENSKRNVIFESTSQEVKILINDRALNSTLNANYPGLDTYYPTISLGLVNGLPLSNLKRFIKIYRTVSYPYFETVENGVISLASPPLTYYPAIPEIAVTSDTQSISNLALDLNDEGIIQFEPLTTSPTQEGSLSESYPVPASGHVLPARNFIAYADVRIPPIQKFALSKIPSSGNTFSFRAQRGSNGTTTTTTTLTWSSTLNIGPFAKIETNASSRGFRTFGGSADYSNIVSDYIDDLSFRSSTSVENSKIAIFAQDSSSPFAVKTYAKATDIAFLGTGNTKTISITPVSNNFDLSKFLEPGFLAVVDLDNATNSLRYISHLFFYESINNTVAAGKIEFERATSIGQDFPVSPITGSTYALFFIPGNDANSFPLYTTPPNPTTLANHPSLSLLPCANSFPTPVAQVGGQWSNSGGFITAPVNYIGVATRGYAQLLDDTATNLVNAINRNAAGVVRARKDEGTGEFSLFGGRSEFEKLLASETGANCTPTLAVGTTPALIKTAERVQNGLLFSSFNAPEQTDAAQFFSPVRVGTSAPIKGLSQSGDDVIILKEEGIFRAQFIDAGRAVDTLSVTAIDSTTFCQAEGSIQEMNETVYFLSQKGFISITGNSIDNISREIESEVKVALARCIANNRLGDIRSFANEFKRLYGCYIPEAEITYVFDAYTRNWTKWEMPIYAAFCQVNGQLITQSKLTTSGATQYFLRMDEYSGGQPNDPLDQHDLYGQLGGTPITINTGLTYTVTPSNWTGNTTKLGSISTLANISSTASIQVGSNYYPVTLTNSSPNLTITLDSTNRPNSGTIDAIYLPVNASATFNAYIGNSPEKMKQFSEYQLHTESSGKLISREFKTDTVGAFTLPKYWTYQENNVTIYRALIPIEASRGRLLIVRVGHTRPLEYFSVTGQTFVAKDTQSFRNQRDR